MTTNNCNCCDGLEQLTPESRYNRPGLAALKYRAGTYGTFLETMLARLSTMDVSDDATQMLRPLLDLTTRELDDSSIAMLDAWAVLADILTFYQERLVNEGFLRTALERRSILELGRLVGYEMRPGVAASVFLAFTVDDPNPQKPILILAGTHVQSLPNPGELPQPFETSEDLVARPAWNMMRPRLSQVQDLGRGTNTIRVKGLTSNLKPNDSILIIDSPTQIYFRQVYEINPEPEQNVTVIFLRGDLELGNLNKLITTAIPLSKPTDNLPQPKQPTIGAIGVPVDQPLSWTFISFNPEKPTHFRFQLREEGSTDWLIDEESVSELEYSPTSALQFDSRYEWRVTTVDDGCADSRPLWTFTTVDGDTFTNLTVEITEVSWNFSWQWNAEEVDNPEFKIKLWLSGEDEPESYSYEPGNHSFFDTTTLPDGSSLPGTGTYIWRVFAIKNDITKESDQVSFTVSPPPSEESSPLMISQSVKAQSKDYATVPDTIISILMGKLSYLKGKIEGSQETTEKLRAELEIAKAPMPQVKSLVQTFNSPISDYDFCANIIWIDDASQVLNNLIQELGIRRGVSNVTGRIFPNNYINLDILPSIQEYLDREIELSSSNLLGNTLIQYIKDSIQGTESQAGLLATVPKLRQEDAQIQTVEQELYRLEIFYRISKAMNPLSENTGENDFSRLTTWIGKPKSERSEGEEIGDNGLIGLLENLISDKPSTELLERVIPSLLVTPTLQPANALQLKRDITEIYEREGDISPQLLAALKHPLKDNLYQTWARAEGKAATLVQGAEALRVKAAHFGATSPAKIITGYNTNGSPQFTNANIANFIEFSPPPLEEASCLILDAEYKEIKPGGWVIIGWTRDVTTSPLKNGAIQVTRLTRRIIEIATLSKENHGKLTKLILDSPWVAKTDTTPDASISTDDPLYVLRNIIVYAQSEPLDLADEPIEIDVQQKTIHLDRLYEGLEPGQWLIISGERTDIPRTQGVTACERVMISSVKHVVQELDIEGEDDPVPLTDDKIYTTIELAAPLAYTYKRDTVTIHGNVVKATHGETKDEVLGHGNGSQARQHFILKQPPLTYLAAPTRKGIESTLEVWVNNIRWPEKENLLELGPQDRGYVTQTDNEQNTTIIFGDGVQGKRLPTGVENVKAVYRSGIGQAGNVVAGQISQLSTRPLGVKEVINPLAASGGANPETADQARWNVPRALLALDRLVSVSDYEDFAHTFAGISKASAAKLFQGRQEVIHLSIAGVNDGPIAETSDLYRALFDALERYGTLQLPLHIKARTLKLLVIIANVKIHPDYLWEVVEPQVRKTLLDTFSFERRAIGQDALVSEAISTMQTVRGVQYVDIDIFTSISETSISDPETGATDTTKLFAQLEQIAEAASTKSAASNVTVNLADDKGGKITPAEIAYLSPDVPDTLILKEIKE